jgi:diguanylate cyclase (GGDEF)-like protein
MATFGAQAQCRQIHSVSNPSISSETPHYERRDIQLKCIINTASVLLLPSTALISSAAYNDNNQALRPLLSTKPAYLLPVGNYSVSLTFDGYIRASFQPQILSVEEYYADSLVHNIMISAFIGFCIALAIYVGILGRSIRNSGFYAYSAYISCAGFYFLLQEGILHALLPELAIFNYMNIRILVAGLTVFTAIRFLVRLLDFRSLLKPWEYQFIHTGALVVLLFSIIGLVVSHEVLLVINNVMGLLTVAVLCATVIATLYATIKKVQSAQLVLYAVGVMLIAMFSRLYLLEGHTFLQRYTLIFAVTLEALLLALAASEKVKMLEKEKLLAFNRASQDSLCPTLNRRGWENAANLMLKQHKQQGGILTLLFIDLDKFKMINDTYGHSVGDSVLVIVSKILTHQARAQDIIGRMGGDEFVIMSHCHSRAQAERLVKRIQGRLEKLALTINEHKIELSASVGANIIDVPHTDLNILLHQTDQLMYLNKNATPLQ